MNSIIDELSNVISHLDFTSKQVDTISNALKMILSNYDIQRKPDTNNTKYSNHKLVDLYIQCKKLEGRASATLFQYKGVIEWMLSYCNKSPEEINSSDIRSFLLMIKETGNCCDRSVDKYREYIQHFYRWLIIEGIISKDPTTNISKIKYDIKEIQPLARNELQLMRDSCYDIRSRAIVETLYSTGCRVTELINIKISDIDWEDKSISVYGKGRKYRTVYLTEDCKNILIQYINSRDDSSDFLFVSIRKPFNNLSKGAVESIIGIVARNAGISKRVTPHVIRHTFATLALQSGMDVTIISKILGHSSLNTTMIYAAIDKNQIKLAHSTYVR